MSLNLSYDFECNVINACKQGDLASSEGDYCSNNSDYCYKTRGCYNSPPLTRILVLRIKRWGERKWGIPREDGPRVPKWLHLQNDSTTEL